MIMIIVANLGFIFHEFLYLFINILNKSLIFYLLFIIYYFYAIIN